MNITRDSPPGALPLRLAEGLRVAPVGDGYVLHDTSRSRLHFVQPIAALFIELCDGLRPADEVERLVVQAFGGEDIRRALGDFRDEALRVGVLVASDGGRDGQATESKARTMTPEELTDLAGTLQDEARFEEALRCQKAAVAMAPDDSWCWWRLSEIATCLGDGETVRHAYERYFALEPREPDRSHLLAAVGAAPRPPRASDSYVISLFDRFAPIYDERLREHLEYRAPELLAAAIREVQGGEPHDLGVLDLGCGTGLAAEVLRPWAAWLEGIDLSPKMLERARERGSYDALHVAEIEEWLRIARGPYDLVFASDVFVYIGDLATVVHRSLGAMRPGGLLAFTVERNEREPFSLETTGRYAHGRGHIEEVAAASSADVAHLREAIIRLDRGVPVVGWVVVLRRIEGAR